MPKSPAKQSTTTGGKRKKSVDETPPVGRWPPEPVDTFGWDTDVATNSKMTKEDAIKLYRLNEKNLEGLDVETKPRPRGGYLKLYVEREVEWRAWEKYGGPVGFWHHLKRVQEENTNSEGEQWYPPRDYRARQRYDLSKPQPPALPDRYLCNANQLEKVKDELPTWFWTACNVELNKVFENGELPSDIRPERSAAVNGAAYFFSKHPRYVGRPEAPLGSGTSLAIGMLRSILRRAASVPAPESEWGNAVQGLVFYRADTEERGYYQWDPEYLDRVFKALSRLVQEAGTGDRGWRSARWEVYYKYAESLQRGLKCERLRGWSDPAGIWLEGRVSPDELRKTLRDSPAGIQYNDLLPWLSSPTVEAGSTGVGPVAGPSSAPG